MELAPLLWPIAALMAVVIAALVRWSASSRTVVSAAFVVFLLAMMASMFLGALVYASDPGTRSLVLGLWVAGFAMSASVFPVVALVLREAARNADTEGTPASRALTSPATLVALVVGLVLLGELLMGRTFATLAGSIAPSATGSVPGDAGWLALSVTSPWFLFPMALEMGLAAWWVGRNLPRPMLPLLLAQAAVMLFSPPALAGTPWRLGSSVASAAIMAGIVGYLLLLEYRGQPLARPIAAYALRVVGTFALMGVGLFVWALYGSSWVFALGVVAQSAVFFGAVVVPEAFVSLATVSTAPTASPSAGTGASG
ncbi:MAG: hypothetical protein L3K18_09350 [Thermoplasmata archaeon]|nr:hypothetical protein [Thermoplasmata archaeon]